MLHHLQAATADYFLDKLYHLRYKMSKNIEKCLHIVYVRAKNIVCHHIR